MESGDMRGVKTSGGHNTYLCIFFFKINKCFSRNFNRLWKHIIILHKIFFNNEIYSDTRKNVLHVCRNACIVQKVHSTGAAYDR